MVKLAGSGNHRPIGCHQGYDEEECYLLVYVKMSWSQAEEFCVLHDGHLASITSAEENAWLGSELISSDEVWLGGQWRPGSDWAWSDGSQWAWTNWAAGSHPRAGTLSVLSSTNIPTTGAPTTVTRTSNLSVNIHRR